MMNYTSITLILLGLSGMILHCLVELNKINKSTDGELKMKIGKYFRYEAFSLVISFIMVIVATVCSQEIKQVQQFGKWLGFGMVAIGYMGQSLLVALMGKAQKNINKLNSNDDSGNKADSHSDTDNNPPS